MASNDETSARDHSIVKHSCETRVTLHDEKQTNCRIVVLNLIGIDGSYADTMDRVGVPVGCPVLGQFVSLFGD